MPTADTSRDLSGPSSDPQSTRDDASLRAIESGLVRTRFNALATVVKYMSQPRWWVELLVIGGLYALYSLIRNSVGEVAATAYRNGYDLLRVEDAWHLALERPLNEWVHRTPIVADVVALHYATLHFIVTPAVLIWVFFRRKQHYRKVSAVLILTTLLALIGFYWYPTAPPRLLTAEGFVDVMSQTASWGWWPESGTPGSDAISNQYAAMPSLHCAWATWCGLSIFFLARRMWVRVLGLIYPFTTYFVVMGSGNHFILDVFAGLATLAVGAAVVFGIRWLWISRVWRRSAGAVTIE